jgi:uncharacterized protein YlxW (UPF0749 family)
MSGPGPTGREPSGPAEPGHRRDRARSADAPPAQTRALPAVDASMGLLHDLMYRPVDAGYAEAAGRPRKALTPAARAGNAAVHLVTAIALGLLTTGAVQNLRAPEPSAIASRSLLEETIADRSTQADDLQRANEEVSTQIAQLQADALAASDPELVQDLERSELLSGAVAVSGPGLVFELDDAQVEEGEEADPSGRVQDLDLQILTNALWAAGAEAIAINGHRLTALSTIRTAGSAIQVDLAPLIPPYRVEAVGDVRAMQTAFARSRAASHLALLTGTYGLRVTTSAQQDLALPGAGPATLRFATVTADGVTSSEPPDQEGSP